MTSFLGVFLFILVGVFWRRFGAGWIKPALLRAKISFVVLHFLLPALVFQVLLKAQLDSEVFALPMAAGLTCLGSLTFGAVFILALKRWSPAFRELSSPQLGAILLACAWGNVTYLGLPVVTQTLGSELARVPILVDLLGYTPLLFTVGAFLGSLLGNSAHPRNFRLLTSATALLRLPPLWAVGAGLAIHLSPRAEAVGQAISPFLQILAAPVAPLMLFCVGLALGTPSAKSFILLFPALFTKLVFSPLIGSLVSAGLFHFQGPTLQALQIEFAMPSMVLPLVIAEQYKLDTSLLAQAIAMTTLLSSVTLPILIFIF